MLRKSYKEKLLDPRWQKKRLKVLERDEFRCQICWNHKATLHVHHKYYEKGKAPWEYPIKALITLCEICHTKLFGKRHIEEETDIDNRTKIEKEIDSEYNAKMWRKMRERLENMEINK